MKLLLFYLKTSEQIRLRKLFHLILIFSMSKNGSSPSRMEENYFLVSRCPPLYLLFQFYVILRLRWKKIIPSPELYIILPLGEFSQMCRKKTLPPYVNLWRDNIISKKKYKVHQIVSALNLGSIFYLLYLLPRVVPSM